MHVLAKIQKVAAYVASLLSGNTAHSPINGSSIKRTPLINGQILFPSHKPNFLVWLSKR